MSQYGVVVGCDQQQQWLLPIWWEAYRRHNRYPVVFVDFGMAPRWARWCRRRGRVIPLKKTGITPSPYASVDPSLRSHWELEYGAGLWEGRRSWFFKLVAMHRAPYEWNLWIDLDCEILNSLAPLFAYSTSPASVGMVREERDSSGKSFNSGVILFRKQAHFLHLCLEKARSASHLYLGDQNIIDAVIEETALPVIELPLAYNWTLRQGLVPGMRILHWKGAAAKKYLRRRGGIARHLPQLDG